MTERLETGVLKADGDWLGIFVRGDEAPAPSHKHRKQEGASFVPRPSQRFRDIPSQLVGMGGKAPLPFSGVLQNSAHMPLGDLVPRFEIAVDV